MTAKHLVPVLIAATALSLSGCSATADIESRPAPVTTSATTAANTATPTPSTASAPDANDALEESFMGERYTLVNASGVTVTSITEAVAVYLDYDASLGDFSAHRCFDLPTAQGNFTLTEDYNSTWAEYDGRPAGRIYGIAAGTCAPAEDAAPGADEAAITAMFGAGARFWDVGVEVDYWEASGFIAGYNEAVGEVYINQDPCVEWATPRGPFALKPQTNNTRDGFTGRISAGTC